MKNLITLCILILSISLSAQNSVEDLIKKGIVHHNDHEYEKAIDLYKRALKIDPNSLLAHYEISYSYFANRDYKNAIKHADEVLKRKDEYMLHAYLTKGSALDMMGKTSESIELFEEAIKELSSQYLLYYNLSLNYYKINDRENAEKNVLKALEYNPAHSSSHLLLAYIHKDQGNIIQSLLAVHYYLLLEPNSLRSNEAYTMLRDNINGNISTSPDKPNTININLTSGDDEKMDAAELMISLLQVSKESDNESKSETEDFMENTRSFFNIMDDLKDEESEGIWWEFYTPFFARIAESNHFETYCMLIMQSGNKEAEKWIKKNEEKVEEFREWLDVSG